MKILQCPNCDYSIVKVVITDDYVFLFCIYCHKFYEPEEVIRKPIDA